MAAVVEVVDLSVKGIRLARRKGSAAVSRVLATQQRQEYWAVRHATFTLQPGEALAVVAKDVERASLLCRALSGLLPVDEGRVQRAGGATYLAGVPIKYVRGLSVEQTVRMTCGILGMTDEQTGQRFDRIVDQAEVGRMLGRSIEDEGRRVREQIGFVCALNTPEPLVVLDGAVVMGTAEFRRSCPEHIRRAKAEGKALVLVTSRAGAITESATHAIRLQGKKSPMIPVAEAADFVRKAKADGDARPPRRRRVVEDDDDTDF